MPDSIEDLGAENRRIEEILAAGARDRLLAVPGVFHVTTGLKETGGRATDELCIKTYVREKRDLADLSHEPVPPVVSGVRTDVSEVGSIRFTSDSSRYRGLKGGIQITNGIKVLTSAHNGVVDELGTLGCFATHTTDGKPVLLTNWHVATANGGTFGDSIFQPEPADSVDTVDDHYPKRPPTAANAVATIVDFKVDNKVDCAIARVNTCYSCCCNCGIGFDNVIRELAVGGSNAIAGTAAAVSGQKVFKVGRSSDRRSGKVVTTSFPSFDIVVDGVTHTFTNQIHIQGDTVVFATNGDSGSVVVDENRKIVGLYFAGDATDVNCFANHIADVLDAVHITITGTEAALVAENLIDTVTLPPGGWLAERVEAHQSEVVTLVNHDRRVTVAWHRAQGPSWLAALTRSVREPAYRLPAEVAGVTRANALARLRDALHRYGGDALRADIELHYDRLLAAFTNHDTTGDLLDALGQGTPATIGGRDAGA
jgi:hypothetical protein